MTFLQKLEDFRPKVDDLIEAIKPLTPEVVQAIKLSSELDDLSGAKKLAESANILATYAPYLQTVQTGLPEIKRVVEMQNQVHYVSDARENIGLVAGNIEDVKAVADYKHVLGAAIAMKPMIDDMLAMSFKMDLVLDMEEDIDTFNKTSERMEEVLKDMNRTKYEISDFESKAKEHLVNIQKIELRINEKHSEIKTMVDDMTGFSVDIKFGDWNVDASAYYDEDKNQLQLTIPQGKPGVKGDDGISRRQWT